METTPQKCIDSGLKIKTCKHCLATFTGKECRPCANARKREARKLNGDEIRAANVAWYAANKDEINRKRDIYRAANPEIIKKQEERSREKNRDKINQRNREVYDKNKVEIRKSRAEKYAASPSVYVERARSWREENPDKVLQMNRVRREMYNDDPDQFNAMALEWKNKNRDKVRAYASKWAKDHPEERRIFKRNRDAKKKACNGVLSKGLSKKLFDLQKGLCPCCKQPLGNGYQLDHKVPLALGGSNTDDNIQLLRRICNQQKGAKHPVDFMQSRGFLL